LFIYHRISEFQWKIFYYNFLAEFSHTFYPVVFTAFTVLIVLAYFMLDFFCEQANKIEFMPRYQPPVFTRICRYLCAFLGQQYISFVALLCVYFEAILLYAFYQSAGCDYLSCSLPLTGSVFSFILANFIVVDVARVRPLREWRRAYLFARGGGSSVSLPRAVGISISYSTAVDEACYFPCVRRLVPLCPLTPQCIHCHLLLILAFAFMRFSLIWQMRYSTNYHSRLMAIGIIIDLKYYFWSKEWGYMVLSLIRWYVIYYFDIYIYSDEKEYYNISLLLCYNLKYIN